tara:strand:+ start:3474 stop:3854 length:381 start_codon:yes stop_codon:yes gene_type:complete
MDAILLNVNWLAVIVGTALAYGLGTLWFGPVFGKAWSAGSHNIKRPARMPMAAMTVQLVGTFLMAWAIGATATIDALVTAIFIILAIASVNMAGSMFSQKSTAAALVDGGYVIAMGIVMIIVQGAL